MKELRDKITKKQGRLISDKHTAHLVEADINDFIVSSLTLGFELYDKFQNNSLEITNPFYSFLIQFKAYAISTQNGEYYFTNPTLFKKEQKALFEALHKTGLDDKLTLFGEFLLGLVRFDLACQLQHQFLLSEDLNIPNINKNFTELFLRLNFLGEI